MLPKLTHNSGSESLIRDRGISNLSKYSMKYLGADYFANQKLFILLHDLQIATSLRELFVLSLGSLILVWSKKI
jgi:hypothetical protein